MFRKTLIIAGAGLALVTQPLAAEDTGEQTSQEEQAFAAMAEMFKVEPLTAEEEARLPAAQKVIGKLIPEGTLAEMMGPMFDKIMKPMMALEMKPTSDDVAQELGLDPAELYLSDEEVAEVAAILDPYREERREREAEIMPRMLTKVMVAMEPSMRKSMSELYAIHFDAQELADIDAFFSTPSGTNFARKSFTMASDPRVMSATMESLPSMMGMFAEMGAEMKAATADLPEPRGIGDLSDEEFDRLVELTRIDSDDLKAAMSVASESED